MSNLTDTHINHLMESSKISKNILKQANLISANSTFCDIEIGQYNLTGIAFPYIDLSGNLLGYRLKKDKVDEYGKYTQAKNTSLNLYFVQSEIEKIKNVNLPLVITEGEKKCLSLLSNLQNIGSYAITSIPGCWNFKSKASNIGQIIKQIPIDQRRIIFLGDSDFFSNRNVYEAYMTLIQYFYRSSRLTVECTDSQLF